MALELCDCKVEKFNTGLANCVALENVTTKLIQTRLFANDGTPNRIDIATFDGTVLSGLINQSDKSKRFYPTPLLENIEDVREDSELEETNSGRKFYVRKGIRSFLGQFWKASAKYTKVWDKFRCEQGGFYFITAENQLVGIDKGDGYLYPVPYDKESLWSKYIKATDTTVPKVDFHFEYSRDVKDSDLGIYNADFNLQAVEGLIDVVLAVNGASTTTVLNLKATALYGAVNSPIPVEGLLVANFDAFNQTANTAVTITAVTESASGVYALTMTSAATAADVIRVEVDKAGLESNTLLITIP